MNSLFFLAKIFLLNMLLGCIPNQVQDPKINSTPRGEFLQKFSNPYISKFSPTYNSKSAHILHKNAVSYYALNSDAKPSSHTVEITDHFNSGYEIIWSLRESDKQGMNEIPLERSENQLTFTLDPAVLDAGTTYYLDIQIFGADGKELYEQKIWIVHINL